MMFLSKFTVLTVIITGLWLTVNAAELSCDKPLSEKVFSFKMKLPVGWKNLAPYEKAEWSEYQTEWLFKKCGYVSCPGKHPVGEQGIDLLAGYFDDRGRLTNAVVHEVKYRESSPYPNFSITKCAKCKGGPEDCTQMSWKWIGNTVGYIGARECENNECDVLCRRIKDRIERKGLGALVRTANTVNDDGTFSFFTVYNDENEKKKSLAFLEYLKNKLS